MPGCTDPLACNYDSTATCDDGSCLMPGCTDPLALNYNTTSGCDDGSCIFHCANTVAYASATANPYASVTVSNCNYLYEYSTISGVGTGESYTATISGPNAYPGYIVVYEGGPATNFIAQGSTPLTWTSTVAGTYYIHWLNDSTCGTASGCHTTTLIGNQTVSIAGCIDPLACNYDSLANTDDGSCTYSSNIIQNVTACDAFIWNGTTYTQSVTDTFITTNSVGCDSTAVLNLTINNSNTSSTTQTACDSYFWNGVVYTSSTTVTYLTTNVSGCDSIATLNLTINNCTPVVCAEDAPTNLSATNVIQNRATINWDNMNSSVCLVDQYRIKFRPVGSSTWTQKTMGQPVGSCLWACNKVEKLILNLIPNTTYEYQMKAWYCGGGASAWTSLHTFTTAPECPNVGNFAVTTPTTKATFTWDDSNGTYSFTRIKSRVDIVDLLGSM